jgi:hypothetical protein
VLEHFGRDDAVEGGTGNGSASASAFSARPADEAGRSPAAIIAFTKFRTSTTTCAL